ncbi:peptidoglycan/xylan/chitin deacetylase (PgdA/CDA1 family) [Robbsia andropogonis]
MPSMTPRAAIPILMYHQIDIVPPRDNPLWTLHVAPSAFRAQMQWLRRLGYRGLSMRDLQPYLHGEKTGKVFGITFDDGFANVLEYAAPVLTALHFTSTCYFVAGKLAGSNDWDAHLGVPATPLMDAAQVRAWHAAGQEVGSHTIDHCHLPQLDNASAERQIAGSKHALETVVDAPVDAFCYPYGDWNAKLADMTRKAGYSNATTTARGRARANDDLFALPRVTVSAFTSVPKLLSKCLLPPTLPSAFART